MRRQVLEVAARTVEAHLNQDHSDTAPGLSCRCGGRARYAGRRAKQVRTVLGSMRLQRAYYHCADCGEGFCPRDRELGLEDRSLSPALVRMVGAVASLVSFQESSLLLEELAGVEVGTKQVERCAESLGEEVARWERETVEPDSAPLARTLYLGMDGTGVPMRAPELQGRAGKQPDGSARTREAKLCTVWSAEKRDEEGRPLRDPDSVTYTAAIESAASLDTDRQLSDFAQRVEREAQRRRFEEAPRQVVLGDAAKWIWNLAGELFPEAVQIVDRFHAKERLHELSKSLYGDRDWSQAMGRTTLPGTRCGSDRVDPFGPRPEEGAPPRGSSRLPLLSRKWPSDALRSIRGPGAVHLHRSGGSRMQKRHRGSTQTIRDALECAGSQFHHGPSLRSTQWTL